MNCTQPTIDPNVRQRIEAKLAEIEGQGSARIILAVESGSRAWGFPSSDSDYDVRFIYARRLDWYLSIEKRRDVIECPIVDDLDISGWDIRKALQLLLKSNSTLVEWLTSPIRYREDEPAANALRDLAQSAEFQFPARFHYLRLGHSQFESNIAGRDAVRLKKYFYSLRPALSLRWLRTRSGWPPMDLPSLRDGLELDREVCDAIDELTVLKARQGESGTGDRIEVLDRIMEAEFAAAEAAAGKGRGIPEELRSSANDLFRSIVNGELKT